MDSENVDDDLKGLPDAVLAAAKDGESSVLQGFASTAQLEPESSTGCVPDEFDSVEGQIALDSFLSGGSERPLMELLARMEGLNVDDCVLRSQPWKPPFEGDETRLKFLGAVDQLVDLQDHYNFLSKPAKPDLKHASAQLRRQEISNGKQDTNDAGSMVVNVPAPELLASSQESEGYIAPDEAFHYDNLPADGQQFRLLGLGPRNKHGAISSLQLETFGIDNAPPFFAISYVWNNPERVVPMTCNNQRLMITNSLGRAMEKLVPWSRGTYLWADAICINRDNIAERNHQVTLMGKIYSRASKVLAHLEDNSSAEDDLTDWSAVSLMTLLNRIWLNEPSQSPRSDSEWTKLLATNRDNTTIWESLAAFWMNSWFTRCWIVQEAVLPDNVVLFYGETNCSLNAVTTLWDLTQRHELPSIMRYSVLADMYTACRTLSLVGSFKKLRDLQKKPSVTGATPESLRHVTDNDSGQNQLVALDHDLVRDSL